MPEDAGPIFDGYAQDTTVTRFVIWRPHGSLSDTEAYIAQCLDAPPDVSRTYVLTDRIDGDVRGAFALRLAAPHRLDCGYVLARAWWGRGLMTEVLTEVVNWSLSQPSIFRRHRQLVSSAPPDADDWTVGIGVYCQPMLQISAQTRNFWVLEALCSAAVT